MNRKFSLDKEWRFHPEDGGNFKLKSHSDSYSASKSGGVKGYAAADFDDSGWRLLNLPHDWFAESAFSPDNLISHGYRDRGNCWYRKTFSLPEEFRGKHILICFDGIAVEAEIYLNGSLMARSTSAYAELPVDITDRAHFGDQLNTLVVYCNGLATEGWWYEGCGIYRHVNLYVKEQTHIAHNGLFAKPVYSEEEGWILELETAVENTSYIPSACRVEANVKDMEGRIIATGVSDEFMCGDDSSTAVKQCFRIASPRLWDIDDPYLYSVEVSLRATDLENDRIAHDAESTTFGFRTIAADPDRGFILNGRPVKLMGTCNHQDHAGVGVAVPDSIQDFRIRRLKEMGTNAYRCSHNMPTRELLDACDRYGMLVMDENRRFESRPEVIAHVETMVRRDRNHPSVVMYSLFNEEPLQNSEEGARIYRRMRAAAERLDDSRLFTGAINGGMDNKDGTSLLHDITGINYSIGAIPAFHEKFPNQPLIGSENNSAVTTRGCYRSDREKCILNNYDEEVVPWGQLIKTTWDFTRKNDYMAGIFIWTGFDYRGEPTPFTWPAVSSQFGIMDTCGFPKDSFYFNKACFTSEPMMHILPHWNWSEGDKVRVMTVTNCEESELFLNGVSLGRKKSDVCSQCEWSVEFKPGILSAKGYNGGVEVVEAANETTGAPARVKLMPDRGFIYNDGADTVPVSVCVLDSCGRIVPTAENHIVFRVEGEGKVLGVGNGSPISHEPDNASERDLFAGWAQALLQTEIGARSLKLVAECDGLESDSFEFVIRQGDERNYIFETKVRALGGWTMSAENLAQRPDPLQVFADNDMNSLTPIGLGHELQSGFDSGYRLYRCVFSVNRSANPDFDYRYTFSGFSIFGSQAEIYLNGSKIASYEDIAGGVELSGSCIPDEANELRILIKAREQGDSGIQWSVKMK